MDPWQLRAQLAVMEVLLFVAKAFERWALSCAQSLLGGCLCYNSVCLFL